MQEIRRKEAQLVALRRDLESLKKREIDFAFRMEDYENRIVNKESTVQKMDSDLQSERGAHVKIQNELRKQQSVRFCPKELIGHV